jgi:hypothetical protein
MYAQRVNAPHTCFDMVVGGEENWQLERRKGSDDFQLL